LEGKREMKLTVAGPKGWAQIEKRNRYKTEKATAFLEAMAIRYSSLEVSKRVRKVEAVTSLHLGIDTVFATLCRMYQIPYTAIIACPDQHRFWDEEAKRRFESLLAEAEKVIQVSSTGYVEGCIKAQNKVILDYISCPDTTLLLVRFKHWSVTQIERQRAVKKAGGQISLFDI